MRQGEKSPLHLIEEEKERRAAGIVTRLRREQGPDLEAAEFFVRAAMLKAGAGVLEMFLESSLRDEQAPVCATDHLPDGNPEPSDPPPDPHSCRAPPVALRRRRARSSRTG